MNDPTDPITPPPDNTVENPPKLHVLVVDDVGINRLVTKELLVGFGCRVSEAADGTHAVDAAAKEVFDVILMDVQMPQMDGAEATRIIRRKGIDIPIIGITAYVSAEQREVYLASGMNAVVTKPVNWNALETLLKDIAGKKVDGLSDPEEPPPDVLPRLDVAMLDGLSQAMPADRLQALVKRALDEVRDALPKLKTAETSAARAKEAHFLVGMCANVGLTALRQFTKEAELAQSDADFAEAVARITRELPASYDALSLYLKSKAE